ncbi:ATP-dependent helicase [Virgibacillus profundi]|uniref:ATP-dependent helicase n=1 Tax=Virgibacillus profundi TaxID=2024555 RepID=A0A2A2I819_9BACI|nr:ATP-dependent helicase [Virgibacillus profundi]PAV27797.1 ATP-dependent helicase [Virgibacillus profundi]PXY52019.1 ATP-dependent helicase [Virgibacillus profundi]
MNKKTVIVREAYDWITEDDIGADQYEELIKYIEDKYPDNRIIEQRYKSLRFINYVGVIVCSAVRYEIIPKINLSKDDERKALLSMLTVTNFLPISFHEKVKTGEGKNDLLSVFLAAFLERLLSELKKGMYKTYEEHSDNLHVLKGKLELTQHIRKNAFQKTKAYCSYDEYTENNLLNQLFKAALFIVRQHTDKHVLKLHLKKCLGYLEEVDLINFNVTKLNQNFFNRQNQRFRDAALFAKMIIEHASIYSQGKQSSSFSFLFPMNLLFEKYIEVALREVVGTDNVISQHAEKRLLKNRKSGRQNILLKPDFVINDSLIVDTKWKSATYRDRSTYNQADIYQMYAYVTAYQDANRCFLLYPKQERGAEHPLWEVIDTDKTIEMQVVRIDDFRGTVEELREIVVGV